MNVKIVKYSYKIKINKKRFFENGKWK